MKQKHSQSAHPSWPSFTEEEAEAVRRVLLSNKVNYWTGTECRRFEEEFADFAGTNHAIALANGTVALDLALHGLGIGSANGGSPIDEVIVTPRSFMASVSCVINAGAKPVFVDVDRDSQNITGETVGAALTENTRAVICVHLAGWPCDMDAIQQVIANRCIKLIEDCAQAHGARYKGRPVGSLGDIAAWSFCQDKIMTTGGEGGMVTCNDEALWRKMWAFKDHGKSYEAVYEREHAIGFRWLHESIGTNWRMTEMQAAIGRIQLRRMDVWHKSRVSNSEFLTSVLTDLSGPEGALRIPAPACSNCNNANGSGSCCEHAWYKFYAFVQIENLPRGWDRDRIVEAFNDSGVPCFQGSCSEIYLEKAFDSKDLRPSRRLKIARELGETSVMLLVHPTLRDQDLQKVKEASRKIKFEIAK